MSENNDDAQEKTFDASEQKLRKSREKGDVPQSQELNTLFIYIGLVLAVSLFSGWIGKGLSIGFSAVLERPEDAATHLLFGQTQGFIAKIFGGTVTVIFALFILLASSIVVSISVQKAFVFAPSKLKPKLSRLSPVENAKQKFGPKGLFEFVKKLTKLIIVAITGGLFVGALLFKLPNLAGQDIGQFPHLMRAYLIGLSLFVITAFSFIVFIDLPFTWFQHRKKLRMTLKEVRDELKESEGDPHMKSERRSRAMALSRGQMLKDVKTADVVIVNPTHYAVALKWDRKGGGAPICVAKGVDELALTLRRVAREAGVPIHSDPPTARSLYAALDIGDMISPEYYAAVAASIKFADMLRARNSRRDHL